jgi:hypothetical protein
MAITTEIIADTVRRLIRTRSHRLTRASSPPKARRQRRACDAETLENRWMLSVVPGPIIPDNGEANLIQVARQQADHGNTNVLNHFPIPFAIQYSGGTAAAQVTNWHAGAPIRLNVDGDASTGPGGNDIQAEVDVVTSPTPELVMTINRLGTGPFASNVNVLIAFPFNSLTNEALPAGMPNLVIGYQTTAPGGATGGTAPASEVITFTPHILGGTSHLFDLNFATTGASNPLTFETGEFDGTNLTGPLDARVITTHAENVPATINVGLNVAQSALSTLPSSGSIGITWDASSATPVTFGYLEDISAPAPASPNFGTTLTFDQMPTHEQVSLSVNETAGTISLSSQSNAVIGAVTLQTTRSDGLTLTGTLSGVPTALDLTIGTAGTLSVNTHGSTLGGMQVTAQQAGGFYNTTQFLGYSIGYVSVGLTNVPSLNAGYIGGPTDSFGVQVVDPTTSIGSVSLLISKDQNLHLPPSGVWANPAWDVFSLYDDGTTGTAAVRIDHIQQATLNLNPASISDVFTLITTAPAPMEAYLRTTPGSHLIPGHDVEVTADIDSFPAGSISFTANLPAFGYSTNPPQTINDIHIFGHIDSTNFDIDAGALPPVFSFDFDPDSHATIVAQDGSGGPATVGHIAAHLWNPSGLSGSGALFGTPLEDAEVRFDQIPSLHATWSNGASTNITFSPDVAGYVGGAQMAVSTVKDLASLPVANPTATDVVTLLDAGAGGEKQLDAGAFGISGFSLNTDDPSHQFTLHYAANQAHLLQVNVNSAFGGRFFPTDQIAEGLTVNAIPGTFDFHTDMATSFVYVASAAIASVNLGGTIDDGAHGPVATQFQATGLPADVDFELGSSNASLTMNDAITHVGFALTDDTAGIFGTPYQLVTATMDDIPAHWNVDWSGGQFVLKSMDASNNPAPMGKVAATISTSDAPGDIANFLQPFQISGPGGARINYSPFLQDVDRRFYQAGGSPDNGAATLALLNDLYNNAQVLQSGEDHAVAQVTGGSLKFFDGQFTGFQTLEYQPNSNGGHFEFDAPLPGLHPFLAGVGLDGNVLIAHLDNVPDSAVLDINLGADNIHFHTSDDFSASPTSAVGNIDVYYGPAGMAQDSDTALRAIMHNVPDDVLINWGFGFPSGAANFTASNEFRLLLLAQDGSNRVVAGLQLKEMEAGYSLAFTPGVTVSTTALVPTSVNLKLFTATAGIDNDTADPSIAANPGKPGISGIFNLYSMTSGPESINDGTSAGASEYTPELTIQLKDFRLFSVDLTFSLGLFPDLGVPHIGGPDINTSGQFALQLWSSSDINDTVDLGPLGTYGFINPPDYTDNTPFFIIPFGSPQFGNPYSGVVTFGGFGTFSDLFDPFA